MKTAKQRPGAGKQLAVGDDDNRLVKRKQCATGTLQLHYATDNTRRETAQERTTGLGALLTL
jgi:hypothetical protein